MLNKYRFLYLVMDVMFIAVTIFFAFLFVPIDARDIIFKITLADILLAEFFLLIPVWWLASSRANENRTAGLAYLWVFICYLVYTFILIIPACDDMSLKTAKALHIGGVFFALSLQIFFLILCCSSSDQDKKIEQNREIKNFLFKQFSLLEAEITCAPTEFQILKVNISALKEDSRFLSVLPESQAGVQRNELVVCINDFKKAVKQKDLVQSKILLDEISNLMIKQKILSK